MTKVDLIIIGAGPGGYETAVRAAKEGLTVAVVEAGKAGGTCLNVGCIPTKCLCRNAEVLRDIRNSETFGVKVDGFSFDIRKAVERKNQVVATLVAGVEGLLKHKNITYVHGTAQFVDKSTIRVADARNADGEPADTEYQASNIIIATGSITKMLPIPGKDLKGVLTSTEMLDLQAVPERLCIVGGGVIGLEFASIYNAFGSEVTVLEFCKEILPNFDADIAKRLKASLKSQGINIVNSAAVNSITEADGHYSVGYELKGEQKAVDADVILMAVGRAANTGSLNLADVGIEADRHGIKTDDNLQTNVEGIYAIGDVNGKCQLAHAASFQGQHALNHILQRQDKIRLDIVPAAVFTCPEAAMVGLTTEQCKQQGMDIKAHKAFFRANGKALSMNETDGMVKVITDSDNKIVGCHLFGPHAADLVQEVAALMNVDARLDDLAQIIHAHPTLGEVVMNAAEN
jgi:dihydrolipoamide dehydrogenase